MIFGKLSHRRNSLERIKHCLWTSNRTRHVDRKEEPVQTAPLHARIVDVTCRVLFEKIPIFLLQVRRHIDMGIENNRIEVKFSRTITYRSAFLSENCAHEDRGQSRNQRET